MDDILAEDITVDEENADLEAGSDSVEEITGDVPGEAVFTSVAGMDSLSGAKLLKEQTRAKSRETFLEIDHCRGLAIAYSRFHGFVYFIKVKIIPGIGDHSRSCISCKLYE